nr:unnamed protein product [Callosobruchus chinensis]
MLDEKLLQERLEQFNPDPLVPLDHNIQKEEIESDIIQKDENNIDLVKVNFLNFLDNDEIKKSCENTIRKYGVGTCGPRAFYAYCKKSDTVFIDEKSNIAIRQGLQSSRCKVVEFKHNDSNSLKEEVEKVIQKEGKKKSRNIPIHISSTSLYRSCQYNGEHPTNIEDLKTLAKDVHNFLLEVGFEVESDPESAFKVFKARGIEEKIYSYCKENGVHLIHNKENVLVMNLNIELSEDKKKIQKVYDVLKQASAL